MVFGLVRYLIILMLFFFITNTIYNLTIIINNIIVVNNKKLYCFINIYNLFCYFCYCIEFKDIDGEKLTATFLPEVAEEQSI